VSELKTITRHAGSVLVGQLAVMAFGVTDTIVAGRYSDTALAALAVGSAVYVSVYVALIGIVQALLPIFAELHGAGRQAEVGRAFRQGLYLCLLIALSGTAVLLLPSPLLRWAQVPAAMQGEVQRYLAVLALALLPSLAFRIYGTLNQALGRPMLVTWLQIASLPVKLPLSIWFVAGGAGLPAMGLVGCAWATLVVNYLMLGLALRMLASEPLYKPYRIWAAWEAPDWRQLGAFARLGVPGGLAYLVEVTSFTLMSLFVARLGTVATASHQIAANLAALLYMMPLSMAIACSARVSYWIGAGQPARARAVIVLGLQLSAAISLVFCALLLLTRFQLAALYSGNAAVVTLAAQLLMWVALYHLADAMQAMCSFLLRCYRVTLLPLAVYGVLLWGLGLLGGYLLSYRGIAAVPAQQSPAAFWVAAVLALALVALVFALLLRRVAWAQPMLRPA
jgi:MATE family multidrug resistance protein